ncbi:MAG: hypothetical protein P8R42_28545 [Candidatus Binatia bacterium]|nr:hypothetical protein [Candidatus Binatia bacterium]
MCYQAKRAPGKPKHQQLTNAHTADLFGSLQIDTSKERELCGRVGDTF